METKTVLIDSNILIEYFRKKDKSKSILYQLSERYSFCISIISDFEVKIGLKTERQWKDYRILTSNFQILTVNTLCVDEAVKIYNDLKKKNKLIELADLLIGASARSYNLPLLTTNKKHFENISDIEFLNLPT